MSFLAKMIKFLKKIKKCQVDRILLKKCQVDRILQKKCRVDRILQKKCQVVRILLKNCRIDRINKIMIKSEIKSKNILYI